MMWKCMSKESGDGGGDTCRLCQRQSYRLNIDGFCEITIVSFL